MPLSVISRNNAEHYTWGNGCDGWHMVRVSNLSVIEEYMLAGASEMCHYHEKAQQFFFILAGQAVMKADRQRIPLSAGQGLRVSPGTYHCLCNESDQPVRFLVISQPPSHGHRIMKRRG